MKFQKHISGNKKPDGTRYLTGYDARVSEAILKQAGFIREDGSLEEYQLKVEAGKIIIEKQNQ